MKHTNTDPLNSPIDLSVVIVNYNVRAFLQLCLHAVQKASQHLHVEVFVVDNASSDDSIQMVHNHYPEVKLIANTHNVGFAKANNQALRIAKGRHVLLLNPDTIVPENAFNNMVAYMDANPGVGGLGTRMVDGAGKFLPESKRGIPTPWSSFYKLCGISHRFPQSHKLAGYYKEWIGETDVADIEVLAGAVMCMRASVLKQVGLLDEDFFMYGEDIDLSYRILKGGYRNVYLGNTTIIHFKGESTKGFSLRYYRNFFGAMDIFRHKHFSRKGLNLGKYIIRLGILFFAFFKMLKHLLQGPEQPLKNRPLNCVVFSATAGSQVDKLKKAMPHWNITNSVDQRAIEKADTIWLFPSELVYANRIDLIQNATNLQGIFHEVPGSSEIVSSHFSSGNGEVIPL